ncbi:MAG: class I SAM-dependent methyltransferase [Succiniclasticum sp.]|jgi:tRNA (adenine22-N1)-methyltransferase|nr:class I SAM-dependent methyltransferase [Succiniclasticum sp.]MEE3478440.1 class I SAM-dependent methyltransferase [Succiniclasticum sp.]
MNAGVRLETVASLVPACQTAADIGTDHGYVPVLLIQSGRCSRVVASDIAEGPCAAARETVSRYALGDRIEVRQAPGLAGLRPGEAEAVVIAGMGGSTIRMILEENPAIASGVRTFVLQPMNGQAELREWLAGHGYCIRDEVLCEERERLYVILVVTPGRQGTLTDLEKAAGPVILRKDSPLRRVWLTELEHHYGALLRQMEHSREAAASEKYRHWQAIHTELEELLQHDSVREERH